jgi:hypothetical protein
MMKDGDEEWKGAAVDEESKRLKLKGRLLHFCLRLRQPQGHSVAVRIRSTEKCSNLIENWACNLRTVPQPTMPPNAPRGIRSW